MKRKIVMLIVFVLGMLFILPIEGLAWRKGTNIGGGHTSIWVGSSVGLGMDGDHIDRMDGIVQGFMLVRLLYTPGTQLLHP